MTYEALAKLVHRLRACTGVQFHFHMLRHSAATEMVRAGVAIEVVSKLLTHRSATITIQTYLHLGVDDLRARLARGLPCRRRPHQDEARDRPTGRYA